MDTCNLTYRTYANVGVPSNTNWISQVIVVSPLTIGTNPVISQIGFYVEKALGNGDSRVDILIYNNINNRPGSLLFKFTSVDLNTFTSYAIACLPYSPTFTIGETIYLGFWTYGNNGNKVIPNTGSIGQYWYSNGGIPSPTVGSQFPNPQVWNSQLVMGLAVGNPCNNLPCSSCTQNTGCVWCLNSRACISTAGIPQCPSWTRNPAFCNACQQFTSCLSCANVTNQCSWCETNGFPSTCVSTPNDGNCTTAITNPQFCGI